MIDKKDQQLASGGLGRRSFINTRTGWPDGWRCSLHESPAPVGRACGAAARIEPCRSWRQRAPQARRTGHFYGLWSGGHGRHARAGPAIGPRNHPHPCFVPDALVGWGITNESKAVMGTKPDGSLRYHGGRYPPHPRFVQGRQLRRQNTPGSTTRSTAAWRAHSPGLLGLRQDHRAAQRAGLPRHLPGQARPGGSAINHTTRVFCGGDSTSVAQRRAATRKTEGTARCSPAWTPETMEVRWQVLIDGNWRPGGHLVRRQSSPPPTSTTPRWAPTTRT